MAVRCPIIIGKRVRAQCRAREAVAQVLLFRFQEQADAFASCGESINKLRENLTEVQNTAREAKATRDSTQQELDDVRRIFVSWSVTVAFLWI